MTSVLSRACALLLAALLLAVGWFGGLYASGNYHEIIPAELYRSGQLSGEELSARIRRDGIRSVVNLRGPQTNRRWYDAEIAATRAAGITHYDVPLLSSKALDQEQADQLVALLKAAPKPVLIHCEGGADRTGLASALYLAATGRPLDEAAGQLSVRYGYVGIEGVTRPWPMWESWRRLGPAIAARAQQSRPDTAAGTGAETGTAPQPAVPSTAAPSTAAPSAAPPAAAVPEPDAPIAGTDPATGAQS